MIVEKDVGHTTQVYSIDDLTKKKVFSSRKTFALDVTDKFICPTFYNRNLYEFWTEKKTNFDGFVIFV